ncbi:GNAT family N-acetyltransferase [bacterium]|jgi:GNAT superfamily N-acetyltransferase|nr:GNAT family N-acetyltransferase [Gammaproteobacteria bacterium]MDC0979910.1 GNAT family N-acetyltransferase [bacterium]
MDETPVIRKLDPSQLEAASNALMMGFSNDPFQRWLMPNPTIYYKNFKKWTINTCKQSFLEEGVYGDENNYGTAVWFPPEFDIDFADVSETYKDIPKDRKAEAFKMFEMIGESRVHDAWYLEYLAVDPSKQGSGLGSLILKESLKVMDELEEAAYLESSNPQNMSLYERFGFRFLKKIQVGSSPQINTMFRQPKK